MKTLIIGCGYVGKAVALELAWRGHKVTGLRRTAIKDPDLLSAGVEMAQGDLADAATLRALNPGFDWVVNCAAASGGGAEDYRRVYLEGTANAIHWLEGGPVRAYVYTSSTGVYGQDDGSDVDESSAVEPESDTGKVLVETERLLLKAAAARKFPAIVLRVAGIYGPGRGYWMRQFLSGEAHIEGEGRLVLNMVHRDDVVGAIIAALADGKPGSVYNVTDNEPVTQRALFEWLARALGRPLPPAGSGSSRARRMTTNKRVLNDRLRNELGYHFKQPTFREGLLKELASMGAL
jgi:nucleoside-diphosphate-sugar epimerase